jgi:4'-phosphopantetheinyl transferase
MRLDKNEVHLWYAATGHFDFSTYSSCRELLSPDELARCDRFRIETNRHEYAAAHALLRAVLSTYAPIRPKDWRFTAGPHGKPELLPSAPTPQLHFNLSHTQGLAAVVVTGKGDVGVDVEWLGRSVEPRLARSVLADAEYLELERVNGAEWARTFFSFWTLKEAYLKACGLGISWSLADFSFAFNPGQAPRIHFTTRVPDVASRWLFWQDWTNAGHCAAVALRRPDGDAGRPPSLVVYQTDPSQLNAAMPGAVGLRWYREARS